MILFKVRLLNNDNMKKSFIFISAALLLIAGCAKEQLVEPYDGPVTVVSASFEEIGGDEDTKATISVQKDKAIYSWEEGDEVAFVDKENNVVKGTARSSGSKASFLIYGALSDNDISRNYSDEAFYPNGRGTYNKEIMRKQYDSRSFMATIL